MFKQDRQDLWGNPSFQVMICYFNLLLLPPIHLYKMLHPVQLDLSYDSMKTTQSQYKMLKNLINFITWMMHFTVILVQLPEGPWRI